MKIRRWTLLAFWLLFLAIPVVNANHTIVVTGIGVDRSAALHDAMRNAIEQKVGLLLDSQTIVRNYQTISDTIYTHSEGYIADYKVLDEAMRAGMCFLTVQVEVSASLDAEVMDRFQKVKAVATGLQDPRIGVLVLDRAGQEYPIAENSLIRILQDNGFSRIVDLKQVESAKKQQISAAIFQGQNSLAQALKTQFPVDYMLVGDIDMLSAGATSSRGFQNFMSAQAAVSLRAYNMNTGEIIYTDVVNGSALHTNYDMAKTGALKNAAESAGPVLVQALMKKATNPLNHIQVVVTDQKLGNISAAKAWLGQIPGVAWVYLRSNSFDVMVFDLNYYGAADSFAGALENAGVRVREVRASFIKI